MVVKQILLLVFAAVLGAMLAIGNVYRTTHVPTASSVDTYAQKSSLTLYGTIAAEPDRRPLQTKYTVAVHTLHTASGQVLPVQGLVLATDHAGFPKLYFGDTVEVKGVLEKPGKIEQFSYANYLRRYGIYAVMYRGTFRQVQMGKPSVLRTLFSVKERFELQINRLYAEPHASFMAGLLTGSRKGIPERTMANFQATGLTHIIAISGYNITIILALISSLLFWVPLRWRIVPSITAIVVFTLFVGANAAVVRAAIMGILGVIALHFGRTNSARLSILWTLHCMLLWNPKYLWYDAGFQLSFLAVIGLVEVSPILEKIVAKIPQTLGIQESIHMTIAAQLTAVPLLIVLFGELSVVAPITNVLVAPFIPLAMLFGFVAVVCSFFWFFGGQIFAYLGWACLEWVIHVADMFAHIPYSVLPVGSIGPVFLCLYYVVLFLCVRRYTYQT